MAKKVNKKGRKEGRLKLKGDWQRLVGKALTKKRPKKGWPNKASKPSKSD